MSLYTLRTGGTAHPEDSVLQQVTDQVTVAGVRDANDTDFEVVENSPTGLSVLVSEGRAYVKKTTSNAYPVRNTADEALSITSNGSGNPRIDAVVLYIDLAATANTDSSNVATLVVVDGTPAASPVAPSDGDIATAIGSSNPFIRLADVTVASGATNILNANILDQRETYENSFAQQDEWVDLADAGTINIDLSLGKKFRVTIAGNRTFTLSNDMAGKTFVLRIKQDATGSRLATFWAGLLWAFGGTAPTLTTTANKADEFVFNILTTGSASEGFIAGLDI